MQVASCGCGSPVCLHTSRLGTAVTPWPIAAIIPAVFPWYFSCNDYRWANKSVSVIINGNDGGTVSCNHVYGPTFGPSGAGNLSIKIATGQRNARIRHLPHHHHYQHCRRQPLSPLSSLTLPTPTQLSSSAAVTIVIFADTAVVIVVILIADYTSSLC